MKKTFLDSIFTGTLALFIVLGAVFSPLVTHAHCPLCTAGAGLLAIAAASLGVPALIISTLLGGFALALGLWFAKLIKKKYIRYQDFLLAGVIYVSTVVPLWPILKEYKTLYAPFLGFDKYADKIPVDVYTVGVLLGAGLLIIAPYVSKQVSALAKKQLIPFQGLLITLVLLSAVPFVVDALFLI